MKKLTLEEQASRIMEQAEARGLTNNYFFVTTFQRYQMQIEILDKLEEAIREHGATVTKEYVKDRKNLVANPAIVEYNKTSTAANGTVSTLLNILKTQSADTGGDSLAEFLDG